MPYRIYLQKAGRVLRCKPSAKGYGGNQTPSDNTDRIEVRSCKGLLLFYRPRSLSLKT